MKPAPEVCSNPTRWGFASVAMPFLGCACAVFGPEIFVPWLPESVQKLGSRTGQAHFFWLGWTWIAFCLVGLMFAWVSRARKERLRRVTAAGFVLNGLLPGAVLLPASCS